MKRKKKKKITLYDREHFPSERSLIPAYVYNYKGIKEGLAFPRDRERVYILLVVRNERVNERTRGISGGHPCHDSDPITNELIIPVNRCIVRAFLTTSAFT